MLYTKIMKIHDSNTTKEIIELAFLELLKEKSYDQITVAELTRKANINRVTFYYHYDNVATLMDEIEVNLANKVIKTMEGLFKTNDFHSITANCFLDAFLSSPEFSILFMQDKTSNKGLMKIYEFSKDICINEWRKYKKVSDEELAHFFDFYFYGSMAYLKNWFNGQYTGNEEDLRKEFISITGHSVEYIFGHKV